MSSRLVLQHPSRKNPSRAFPSSLRVGRLGHSWAPLAGPLRSRCHPSALADPWIAATASSMRNRRPLTIDGPMGRMVLAVLGMIAEMELGFVRDRQLVGIEEAEATDSMPYAGLSSTTRPSLQPYLASKSASRCRDLRFAVVVHDAREGVELSLADPDLDLWLRLNVAHPVGALALGNKVEAPTMLCEPDLDFTRVTGDAASGG